MKLAFGIFVLAFLISTVFIAPFVQFRGAEKERTAATNEVARLTPAGSGDAPYVTLAKELAGARSGLENEKKARTKAEGDAERYRQQGLNWLFAITNSSSVLPVLDEAIAVNRREHEAMMATNRPNIAVIRERESEFKKLEKLKEFESKKDELAQYLAFVRYAISAFQDRFSAPIEKCGGKVKPFAELPEGTWWSANTSKRVETDSTNCGVKFQYVYISRFDPMTVISMRGRHTEPARVEFILSRDPIFHSRFFTGKNAYNSESEGDFQIFKGSALSDKKQCISEIDYVLDLLLDSQKEELQ